MAFVMSATLMTLPASPAAANPRELRTMVPPPATSPTMAESRLASTTIPDLSKHPLQFEANVGQGPADVRYFTRVGESRLLMTDKGAVLDLRAPDARARVQSRYSARAVPSRTERVSALMRGLQRQRTKGVVRMELIDSAPVRPVAEARLPGVVHYFVGRDPRHWHTNVPTFGRIRYQEVYPGIDIVFYGNGRNFEYDFVLAPGADPHRIRLAFRGVDAQQLSPVGDLLLTVDGQTIRHRRPQVYQEVAGVRRPVPGRYVVAADGAVRFELGSYLAHASLVIDPLVDLGNGDEGVAFAAVGDASGNTYVTGVTSSPLPGTVPNTYLCSSPFLADIATDAFVVKLDPSNGLLWKAILGGRTGADADCSGSSGLAVALDATGANVFVAGATNSSNFVVTDGVNVSGTLAAFQTALADEFCLVNAGGSYQGSGDGFVVKLSSAGALQYGTYVGGNLFDFAQAVAVDSAGNAYVTGGSQSQAVTTITASEFDNFPTPDSGPSCATRLQATPVAFDDTGAPTTYSIVPTRPVFPSVYTSPTNVLNTSQAGGGFSDIFVAKLSATGSVVSFMTLQGGAGDDAGSGIVVNTLGEVVVTGDSYSVGDGAALGVLNPEAVTVAAGARLPFAAPDLEYGFTTCPTSVSVGFKGATFSNPAATPPIVNPLGPTIKAGPSCTDVVSGVLSKYSATSGAPTAAYLVGGTDVDTGVGVAIDAANNVYLTGQTLSGNFPVQNPVVVSTPDGVVSDPSVQLISPDVAAPPLPVAAGYVVKVTLPAPGQPATQTTLGYSSPLGGTSGDTLPSGIAVTPAGAVFVSGTTTAVDNTVIPPAVVDPSTGEVATTAYLLQIPAPPAPNTAPTVTTDGQLSLGALDPNVVPPTLTISTDVDGNVVIAGAPSQEGGTSLGAKITAMIPAEIDVKPRVRKNQINLETRTVQVAIKSSPTFDAAARIDRATIRFGKTGDEASLLTRRERKEDVPACKEFGRKRYENDLKERAKHPNREVRLPYLVCVFKLDAADFAVGDTVARLTAKTKAGADLAGSDEIVVKAPRKGDKGRDRDDDDGDCQDDD
jgi:hypothetical protein